MSVPIGRQSYLAACKINLSVCNIHQRFFPLLYDWIQVSLFTWREPSYYYTYIITLYMYIYLLLSSGGGWRIFRFRLFKSILFIVN